MKIFFIAIILLSVCLTTKAQIDFNNPPWQTGCDSLTTQTEMNVCSYEEFHIADSILNLYYKQLINYVDSLYKDEVKTNDTTNNIEKEYLQQLKNEKSAIIKSKSDFKNFRNSITDIIAYKYQNGSMQPMAINGYALDLTVDQIKTLMNLMSEIMDE